MVIMRSSDIPWRLFCHSVDNRKNCESLIQFYTQRVCAVTDFLEDRVITGKIVNGSEQQDRSEKFVVESLVIYLANRTRRNYQGT